MSSPSQIVGGKTSSVLEMLGTANVDGWMVNVLKDGYRIPFLEVPLLSEAPIPFESYLKGSERFHALDLEVENMVKKGAIEEVTTAGWGFYSRIFVVPKASGGWQPVIDLRPSTSI